MTQRGMKALILWQKEHKTGIESVNNIPENSRFAGAVTPVLFSGDKKWYPAKVIMIHEDMSKLEEKAEEIEDDIEQQEHQVPQKRKRLQCKRLSSPSVASEADVAVAVGGRKPVPKHLEAAKKATLKTKRTNLQCKELTQSQMDTAVMSGHRRALFSVDTEATSRSSGRVHALRDVMPVSTHSPDMLDSGTVQINEEGSEVSDDTDNDEGKEITKSVCSQWCSCTPCQVLQKYDSPTSQSLFRDLLSLFSGFPSGGGGVRYLDLLELNENAKKVELTGGKDIFISVTDKNRLKVDFANKPPSLVRETLFSLYGKEAFRLSVTARGSRPGSYGIQENVLEAVLSFVNRHVEEKKKMKMTDLVNLINKRSGDWRSKVSLSPAQRKFVAKGKKNKADEVKVVATSPWKTYPLHSTSDEEEKSTSRQRMSPESSRVKTPTSCSPSKVDNASDQPAVNIPAPHPSPFTTETANVPAANYDLPSHPPYGCEPKPWAVPSYYYPPHHVGFGYENPHNPTVHGAWRWQQPQEQQQQWNWNYNTNPNNQTARSPNKSSAVREPTLTPL